MTNTLLQNPVSNMLRAGLLMLGLLFTLPAAAAEAGASPKAVVQTTVDAILAVLRKPDFDLAKDRTEVKNLIVAAFDDTAMAQSVLSTAWRDATPAQQTEFKALLLQTIEDTYLDRIQVYTNEVVEFRDEEVRENRATVNTFVITKSGEIPVNYKMRLRNDGRWLVYDVEIENVSMVSSYRDTYRDIVGRDGLDGLLEQLRAKAAPVPEV